MGQPEIKLQATRQPYLLLQHLSRPLCKGQNSPVGLVDVGLYHESVAILILVDQHSLLCYSTPCRHCLQKDADHRLLLPLATARFRPTGL